LILLDEVGGVGPGSGADVRFVIDDVAGNWGAVSIGFNERK
jgi:hypothetical protein